MLDNCLWHGIYCKKGIEVFFPCIFLLVQMRVDDNGKVNNHSCLITHDWLSFFINDEADCVAED